MLLHIVVWHCGFTHEKNHWKSTLLNNPMTPWWPWHIDWDLRRTLRTRPQTGAAMGRVINVGWGGGYLVGGLDHRFDFLSIGDDDPIWRTPIFFRGVGIPKTSPASYDMCMMSHWWTLLVDEGRKMSQVVMVKRSPFDLIAAYQAGVVTNWPRHIVMFGGWTPNTEAWVRCPFIRRWVYLLRSEEVSCHILRTQDYQWHSLSNNQLSVSQGIAKEISRGPLLSGRYKHMFFWYSSKYFSRRWVIQSTQSDCWGDTFQQSNMAMENPPFMDDFPIETSIYMGFPSLPCLITGYFFSIFFMPLPSF